MTVEAVPWNSCPVLEDQSTFNQKLFLHFHQIMTSLLSNNEKLILLSFIFLNLDKSSNYFVQFGSNSQKKCFLGNIGLANQKHI